MSLNVNYVSNGIHLAIIGQKLEVFVYFDALVEEVYALPLPIPLLVFGLILLLGLISQIQLVCVLFGPIGGQIGVFNRNRDRDRCRTPAVGVTHIISQLLLLVGSHVVVVPYGRVFCVTGRSL